MNEKTLSFAIALSISLQLSNLNVNKITFDDGRPQVILLISYEMVHKETIVFC